MEPMKLTVSSESELSLPSPGEIPDERLLSRREASRLLAELGVPLTPATLAKLFCISSDGPPVVHFGRFPRYRAADLRAWALSRLTAPRRSSSEPRRTPQAAAAVLAKRG
jgi:hypothetical protein